MEEYAKLSVVLQNTECEFLNRMYAWSPQKEKIMMTGRKRPCLNSKKDVEK